MGYPTQQQKVDYLFKKIGFTKTKTGVAEDQTSGFSGDTKKAPPNEAIASPLIVPGSSVWSDSSFITATPPTSSTAYVGVYSTATSYRMTVDTTVANERTFIARQTWGNPSSAIEGDWIDTQFGADYLVKVYMGDPSTGVPGVAYTNLSAAGTSGKDDVWFFDYSSGVLNFNGADLDGQLAGISTDNVYLVGYRYIGRKGIQPPAGIGTFHDLVVSNNLSVGGISTFNGVITFKDKTGYDNHITYNVHPASHLQFPTGPLANLAKTPYLAFGDRTSGGDFKIYHDYYNTHLKLSGLGGLNISNHSNVISIQGANGSGGVQQSIRINAGATEGVKLYQAGAERFETTGIGVSVYGQLDTTTLNVAGVSTFGGIIEGIAGENKIPSLYANYSNLPNAGTYHGMFAHVHATQKGYFAHAGGWYELVNKETTGVVGTGTETYHIGNLNVTGITTLGNIGVSTGLISGPAITYIDPATVGDNTGTLVVKGNLQVEGTQTTVNSSTMTVTDKNIELAKGAANDAAADGGGITVDSGGGDKTWQWLDATDSWTSSEHIRIPDGKVFGFASDTNTYIGRPAADTIAFTHGGSERVRITSSQTRIGSQAATDTTSYEIQLSGATNNDSILSLYNPTNNDGEGINFGFFFNNTNGNATQFAKIESNAIETQANSTLAGDLRFYTADGDDSPNLQEKLRIESDGKVGINSITPTALLDVNGTLNVSGVGTFASSIHVADSIIHQGDANTQINFTNDQFEFKTNNVRRLHVLNGNNFLYGSNHFEADTAYPKSGQYVARFRDTTGDDTVVHFHNTNVKNTVLRWNDYGSSSTAGNFVFTNLSGTEYARFTGSGNFNLLKDLDVTGNTNVVGILTAQFLMATGGSDANKQNVKIGWMNSENLTTGGYNVLIGRRAGEDVDTASNLVIIGANAGFSLTNQNSSVIIGSSAGNKATGDGNVYIGKNAAQQSTSAASNVIIGTFAGIDNQGNENTLIGYYSGRGNSGVTDGTRNTFVGTKAGFKIEGGDDNTSLGRNSLAELLGGNKNVAIGQQAGDALVSGNNNIIIGYRAEASTTTTSNEITLGDANITKFRIPGIGVTFSDDIVTLPAPIDASGDLTVGGNFKVVGISTLSKEVGIGSALNVVGVSTFNDDVRLIDHKSLYLGTSPKSWIRYNNILNTSQWYNVTNPIEIGYRPTHLMWLTDRVLSTKLGGVNITGDTETDTLNVSGGATFTGTISAGSTTGTNGYYLKTTGIGVTWAAFPSSRTTSTQTATAGQTSFNFSYNVGFLDVFVNGVKLPTSEFTASNGSTVVLDDAAFADDTLEFVSYNTVPNSSAGAQNLTGLADVTITGTPVIGETLQHNGSQFVNDYTVSATTTSTSQTAILNLPVATYRSAEYTIQITEGTKYHVTKILAIHDGTNVTFNEYGTLFTTSSLSTFALDISSGSMRLLVTPASTNSTVFKVKFTGIKV